MMHKSVLLGLVLCVGLAVAIDEVIEDTKPINKRWWGGGWGGYGLGLGYGGYGLGMGYPYYGFYGKRDAAVVTEPKEETVVETSTPKLIDLHIGKREAVMPVEETKPINKRWWGGWGGYGLGMGYGLGGFGYPYYGGYGFYGKRDTEPIMEDKPKAERLIDLHIGKREEDMAETKRHAFNTGDGAHKRSVDEVMPIEDEHKSINKRWWGGWGGYGLGMGYGLGGFGYPYYGGYGFYGKRDTEPMDKRESIEVEKPIVHKMEKREAVMSADEEHKINMRVPPWIDRRETAVEETKPINKRWWGGWGGYGLGMGYGLGGFGYPYYGGYGFYGKRDADSTEKRDMMDEMPATETRDVTEHSDYPTRVRRSIDEAEPIIDTEHKDVTKRWGYGGRWGGGGWGGRWGGYGGYGMGGGFGGWGGGWRRPYYWGKRDAEAMDTDREARWVAAGRPVVGRPFGKRDVEAVEDMSISKRQWGGGGMGMGGGSNFNNNNGGWGGGNNYNNNNGGGWGTNNYNNNNGK